MIEAPLKVSDREKEEVQEVFNKVIESTFTKLDNEALPLQIRYMNRNVLFNYNLSTTFMDLAIKVGQYFSLPSNSIHFMNDDDEIMPTHSNIARTLLPWKTVTFKGNLLTFSLVLGEAVTDVLEPRLDKIEMQSTDDTHFDDTTLNTDRSLIAPTKAKAKLINDLELHVSRKKEFWTQIAIQLVLYATLTTLWYVSRFDKELLQSNSFTQGMHKLMTNEVLNEKYEYSMYEVSDFVFTRIRTLPQIESYLSYLQTIVFCVDNCIPFTFYRLLPVTAIYVQNSRISSSPSEFYDEDVALAWPSESTSDYGTNETYTHSTASPGFYVKGFDFWYNVGGFKEDINTTNPGTVMFEVNKLILNNFIVPNTRTLYLFMNFFNPNIQMVMPVMALFQVDACQNVAASIKYAMFSTAEYPTAKILYECFLLLISFMLVASLLYEMTFLKDEISNFKKFLQPSDAHLTRLKAHLTLSFRKRLRKPRFDEKLGKELGSFHSDLSCLDVSVHRLDLGQGSV